MPRVNPNIEDISYTRPDAKGQSAARLVRYLTRRPDSKERPGRESQWRTLPREQVFGDPDAFKTAANRRRRERVESARQRGRDLGQDHSEENVSYVHVVLSPKSREAFRDEDFEALLKPWIKDRKGRPCAYFAAVHYDDPQGPKIHLAVARGRVHRTKELPQLRAQTAELIEEREMLLERSRYPEHVQERDRQHDRDQEREATMQHDQRQDEQAERQHEEEARQEEQAQEEQAQQQAQDEAQREEQARTEEERQVEERRREREAREREERERHRERGR